MKISLQTCNLACMAYDGHSPVFEGATGKSARPTEKDAYLGSALVAACGLLMLVKMPRLIDRPPQPQPQRHAHTDPHHPGQRDQLQERDSSNHPKVAQ